MNLSLTLSYDSEPYFPVDIEEDKEAQLNAMQIRLEAVDLAHKGMFINSAKMLLKLFDTNIKTTNDSLMLHKVICHQLERKEACADFNLSEIMTIKSSCKEVIDLNLNDYDNDIRAAKLLDHLNSLSSKTADLVKTIDNITANTLLVLESQKDAKCLLTQNLPPEIFHNIALQSHAIIEDINKTPIIVGLTNERFFGQQTSSMF